MDPKNVRAAGLLLLAAAGLAAAQEATEQDVLSLFDRQSPMKREAGALVASTLESLRARTLWPNPVAGYSRETAGFTEFLQAEQPLPLSGRLGIARQALEPARESAEAEGASRLWAARSALRAAFHRALAAQEHSRILRASLAEMQSVLDLLTIREREGEGSRYDRMRVEREAAELRADLSLAQARARAELALVLSYLPPQTQVSALRGDLGTPPVPLTRDDLLRRALANRQELRAETRRLSQLDLEQKAAGRLRFPEPSLVGGLKRVEVPGGQNAAGAVIGVSIPIPLFNRGQTEVARLAAEKERARARADLLAQQIQAAVSGAYDLYVLRSAALQAFDNEMRDAAGLLRVARVGYQEGELGILQLLDAYRLERQRAVRRVDLQAAVKEAEIELSRSAGVEVTP